MEDWSPLYDKLIVRRDPPPDVIGSAGQFVAPETAKTAQSSGVVLKVGIGRLDITGSRTTTLLVSPGDRVLFGPFSGIALDQDEPDTIVLREDEILAYRRPV
jgi:co-chaperonin GroES (HSP10)